MLRKFTALFFLSVFIGYTSLPTVLSVLNTDIDISLFIDTNEEESKEGEASKEKDVKIIELNILHNSLTDTTSSENNTIYLKKYTSVYLNLLSPPPENS
jgi:pyridoxine 5'-phosphate synthase PdxJ